MVRDQQSKKNRRKARIQPEPRNDDQIIRSERSYLFSHEPGRQNDDQVIRSKQSHLPSHEPTYLPSPKLILARDAQHRPRQESLVNLPPLPSPDRTPSLITIITVIGGISTIDVWKSYPPIFNTAITISRDTPAAPLIVPSLSLSSSLGSVILPPLAPIPPPALIPPTTTIYYGPPAPSTVDLTPLSTIKPCTTNALIQSFFRFSVDASSWCSTYLASLHYYTTSPASDRIQTELGLPDFVSEFYYPRITNLGPFDRDDMLSGCSCWYPWTLSQTTSTSSAILVSSTSLSSVTTLSASRPSISTLPSITSFSSVRTDRSQSTITSLPSALNNTSTKTHRPQNDGFLVRIEDGTLGSMKLVPMFVVLPIASIAGMLMLMCTCLCNFISVISFSSGHYNLSTLAAALESQDIRSLHKSQAQKPHHFVYKAQAERRKPRHKNLL